ncbi:MAG: galactokinase [Desulfobacterales bacterium]|nr:galactokinase [Desulfobacterales bacterium]
MNFNPILSNSTIAVSVPCRVDFGGTLDISTFYLALKHKRPATLNLALDMRTRVTLSPWESGRIKISSRGFDPVEQAHNEAGIDHPLGLMFAVARYFDAHGVHVHIESGSPPRSALGGSSSAAVAVAAAFYAALKKEVSPEHVSWLAHYIESSVAGVPCGMQDQTAAAFGGANLWEWKFGENGPLFDRVPVFRDDLENRIKELNTHILVAYCGIPHESKDINGQWVKMFKSGVAYHQFEQIADITRDFHTALASGRYGVAGELMVRETEVRGKLTPEVLDKTGKRMFEKAKAAHCGARFTGAGGGGCLWAVGEQDCIQTLSAEWRDILEGVENGRLLDTSIDTTGIRMEDPELA